MQISVIEFSRNVLGLKKANSTEFDINTPHPVISPLQNGKTLRGVSLEDPSAHGRDNEIGSTEMQISEIITCTLTL